MILKLRKMEHTDLYTGLRKSKDRKMEQLKVKSGRHRKGTLVIGRIMERMVLVFSFTKMETSMKVCGELTKDTDKELIGALKETNYAENTLVIGLKTRNTVEAPFSSKTATGTTGTG